MNKYWQQVSLIQNGWLTHNFPVKGHHRGWPREPGRRRLTDLPGLLHQAEKFWRHILVFQVDGKRECRDTPERQRHVQLVVASPDELSQELLVAVTHGSVEGYQLPSKLLFTEVGFTVTRYCWIVLKQFTPSRKLALDDILGRTFVWSGVSKNEFVKFTKIAVITIMCGYWCHCSHSCKYSVIAMQHRSIVFVNFVT